MNLVPLNIPKKKDITPKNYFIWGQPMSGKTYLACKFPNPILINTDGNGVKVETPSVQVTDFETFVQIIKEFEEDIPNKKIEQYKKQLEEKKKQLEEKKKQVSKQEDKEVLKKINEEIGTIETILPNLKPYETLIIDLIDDIKILLDNYIIKNYIRKDPNPQSRKLKEETIKDISDIPHGKGWYQAGLVWDNLMMRLTSTKYNIVFISHITQMNDDLTGSTKEMPSLNQKLLNRTMKNCDVSIKCLKMGTKFLQICDGKRENYKKEDIQNEEIYNLLKNVSNLIYK